MSFDPDKKRKELKRRGWSPKRIDAYMNHSRKFIINPEKQGRTHEQSKRDCDN